jgi:predicted nucleic acid-binding Zn finger protein
MTTTTKATEAYEAKITAAVATVQQRSENVFIVPSSRKGVAPQVITTDENGVANYCSCESFQFNGWERYGHKCYHAQAVERYIEAQKAVAQAEAILAEEICNEQEQELGELSLIAGYVAQGVSYSTAERIVNAKGIRTHGNAKAYESKAFSFFK